MRSMMPGSVGAVSLVSPGWRYRWPRSTCSATWQYTGSTQTVNKQNTGSTCQRSKSVTEHAAVSYCSMTATAHLELQIRLTTRMVRHFKSSSSSAESSLTSLSMAVLVLSSTTNSMSKRDSSESGSDTFMLMLLLRSYVPYSGLAAASTLQRAFSDACGQQTIVCQ